METSSEVSSSSSSLLPLTPTSPLGVAGGVAPGGGASGENMELILEYWNPKGGQKEKVCTYMCVCMYVCICMAVTGRNEH